MLIHNDILTEEGIKSIVEKKPVTFILGDNMDFLRWCYKNEKYKYFHLGIVDPPYGINAGKLNFGSRAATRTEDWKEVNRSDWDSSIPTQEYWDLLWYCCRNLIVWGGNYFVGNLGQVASDPYTRKNITGVPNGRCAIAWDKLNDKMSFAGFELALTTIDQNAFLIRKPRNLQEQDGDKRHRTQKPVYLYDALYQEIEIQKNWRILDTHGGSHSHAIAAQKNNMNLTIIEVFERYHLDALQAYDEQAKPRLLF